MPYAKLDENGRIEVWSREKLDGFDVEFANGDYVNENCVDGLDEFVIEGGKAVYSPLPEKQVKRLKQNLADTDYIAVKIMDALVDCNSIADFISTMAAFREQYCDKIAARKKWREEINSLDG